MSLLRSCVCDLCRFSVELDDASNWARPPMWGSITLEVRPPKGESASPIQKKDLCPACVDAFSHWDGTDPRGEYLTNEEIERALDRGLEEEL